MFEGPVIGAGETGKSREHLLQGDARLKSGEGSSETKVDAVPERHVSLGVSRDVKHIRVGKPSVVAVG